MRVVVAPDKFRGTATAAEAAAALATGVRNAGHRPVSLPMADGGEGLLDVFGGANRVTSVSGPLGDDVDAGWRFDGRTAIIEMARASGLHLVGGADDNDAVAASTWGLPPALFTTTSTRPQRRSASPTNASTWSGSRTSHAKYAAVRPPVVGSSSGSDRPHVSTSAPSSRNRSQMVRPMPLLPPVTMTTWPLKSMVNMDVTVGHR